MNAALRIVAALCAALALTGCGRSASYRYKLTLSLNTPDGVRTGFNVVEIRYFDVIFPERGEVHDTRGQALYLDLGQGKRPLIALLTHIRRDDEVAQNGHPYHARWLGDSPSLVLEDVCLGGAGNLDWIETAIQFNQRCRQPFPITPADLPNLVTFGDVNNPKSVMLVEPNNLAATLGPGVSWRSMTLEVTNELDDPLTKGIDEHLPWIRGYQLNMRSPELRSFQGLNDFVRSSDFTTGM
ncbi:MAG TPA: hypothetical protein VHY56_00655 [Candidatus Binataceae bacterium]|nr:hypothetical protein [Candidatus Binataceae bacterium]